MFALLDKILYFWEINNIWEIKNEKNLLNKKTWIKQKQSLFTAFIGG